MLCPVCSKSDEDGFVLCDTCDEGGGHFGCLGLEVLISLTDLFSYAHA